MRLHFWQAVALGGVVGADCDEVATGPVTLPPRVPQLLAAMAATTAPVSAP
ncbi:hypothetical protein [Streptomyces sp. NPDC048309]|uniref:hypothetical protein n=1 Tax=Streptomyces sp. NPDC048309 TaxID=3154618 RepID=UPI0034063DDC